MCKLRGNLCNGDVGEELVWKRYDERKGFYSHDLSKDLHPDCDALK